MPHFLSAICLLALTVSASSKTAFEAVKLLPPQAAENLARIEAREGAPAPEKWHILTHEPDAPAGLREYVVSEGKIVSTRIISQFAESLRAADVIGSAVLKVDSDKAAELAQEYAAANKMEIAAMNYRLHKESKEAIPVWRITCLDAEGETLGALVVTAGLGQVLAADGFSKAPKVAEKKEEPEPAPVASRSQPRPRSTPRTEPRREVADRSKPDSTSTRATPRRNQASARRAPRNEERVEVRRAEPVAAQPIDDAPRPSTARRIGETMRKLLPF